ncbi:hypothetical protein [Nitrospira sp. Kam-Ns4a]
MQKLLSVEAVLVAVWLFRSFWWTEIAWALPEVPPRVQDREIEWRGSNFAPVDLSQLVKRAQKVVSLNATYTAAPQTVQRLQDLDRQGQEARILSLLGKASFFDDRLAGEAEISQSPSTLPTSQGLGDAQHRLLRFGATGTLGAFRCGLTYRSAGAAFLSVRDQVLREMWGEWQVGFARWRTSRTETWNNLEKVPSRARFLQDQRKTSLILAPAFWPELSLSYGRTVFSSTLEPAGMARQRSHLDTFEGALSIRGPVWTARLASLYSLRTDDYRSGLNTAGVVHAFSGSYQPDASLAIVPNLSLREDRQTWSGVRISTLAAALSVNYALDREFNFTTSTSYSETRSTDRLVDSGTFSAKGVVAWNFQTVSAVRCALSLDIGYKNVFDAIHPAVSMEDLYGLIRVQLVGI